MSVWYRFKISRFDNTKYRDELRSCLNIKFTHVRFRLKPSNQEMPQF